MRYFRKRNLDLVVSSNNIELGGEEKRRLEADLRFPRGSDHTTVGDIPSPRGVGWRAAQDRERRRFGNAVSYLACSIHVREADHPYVDEPERHLLQHGDRLLEPKNADRRN